MDISDELKQISPGLFIDTMQTHDGLWLMRLITSRTDIPKSTPLHTGHKCIKSSNWCTSEEKSNKSLKSRILKEIKKLSENEDPRPSELFRLEFLKSVPIEKIS
jgi:hypothetical protein